MAKFSTIAAGALARRPFEFTLPSGTLCKVDLGLVLGEAEAYVLKRARAYAIERGVSDPKKGDDLYEFGIWVFTLEKGIIDPDSPPGSPAPFFDGGAEQILDEKKGLGREWIALLFEAQQHWQDEVSPRPGSMTAIEFFSTILEIAEAPPRAELPFFRWRRVLQDSFLRTVCKSLLAQPLVKSSPGPSLPDVLASFESSAKPSMSPTPTTPPAPPSEATSS